MSKICNFNGEIIPNYQSVIPIYYSAIANAESITECLRVFNQKICFAEEHYFHLMASMRIMRMPIPMNFTLEFLENEVTKIIEASGLDNALVKLQVAAHENQIVYWLIAEPAENTLLLTPESYEIDVYREAEMPTGFFHQLYTPQPYLRIVRTFATENKYDDLVLLNPQKRVLSFLHGSLFFVQNNEWITPSLEEGAQKGVWRSKWIEMLTKAPEYDIQETEITPFALQKADEVWVVIEGVGAKKVTQLRKKTYENHGHLDILSTRLNETIMQEK